MICGVPPTRKNMICKGAICIPKLKASKNPRGSFGKPLEKSPELITCSFWLIVLSGEETRKRFIFLSIKNKSNTLKKIVRGIVAVLVEGFVSVRKMIKDGLPEGPELHKNLFGKQ